MSTSTSTGTAISGTGSASSNGFSTLGAYLERWRPRFGTRTGNRDSEIVEIINEGVADIARQLPDNKLIYGVSVSVVSGTATYFIDDATYRCKRIIDGTFKVTDSSSNDTMLLYIPHHGWEPFKVSDNGGASPCTYFTVLRRGSGDLTRIELYDTPAASYTLSGEFIYRPGNLSVGQDSSAIPLPEECESALNAWLRWKASEDMGRAVTEIQTRASEYMRVREEFAHDESKTNVSTWGTIEPDQSRYLNSTNDYTDL